MRMPRWLSVIFGLVFFSAIYYAAPLGLSMLSQRHWWIDGHPAAVNYLGLAVVLAGAALVLWVQLQHFESAPAGWRMRNPMEGPGYVLTSGPYRFCRHPMHIASIAIWLGSALYYGSAAVGIVAGVLLLTILVLVPTEEGDEYRRYKARVPRWPWQSPKP